MARWLLTHPDLKKINEENQKYFRDHLDQSGMILKNEKFFRVEQDENSIKKYFEMLENLKLFFIFRSQKGNEFCLKYLKIIFDDKERKITLKLNSSQFLRKEFIHILMVKNSDCELLAKYDLEKGSIQVNPFDLVELTYQIYGYEPMPYFEGFQKTEIDEESE